MLTEKIIEVREEESTEYMIGYCDGVSLKNETLFEAFNHKILEEITDAK